MNPIYLFSRQETPIRKLLMMHLAAGGKLIEQTATGNPLTFVTDVIKPLVSLVLPFTPVQSGSGDPSPDNVRPITGFTGVNVWHTGKNLFDINQLWDNGTNRGTGEVNRYYKMTVANGKYTVSTNVPNNTNPAVASVFVTNSLVTPTSNYDGVFDGSPKTLNVTNGELYIYIRVSSSGGYLAWDKTSFADYYVQVEIGQTVSTYSEYTGASYPVTFPAFGKNLLDMQYGNKVPSVSTGQMVSSNGWSSDFVRIDNSKNYYLSAQGTLTSANIYTLYYDADYSYLGYVSYNMNHLLNNDDKFASASFVKVRNDSSQSAVINLQLEIGTSANSYEPYTSTAYGGSLNLTTGVLMVEWAEQIFDGTDNYSWNYAAQPSTSRFSIATSVFKNGKAKDSGDCLFNYFKFSTSSIEWNGRVGNTGNLLLYVPSSITTREALRSYFSEHTLQLVYELATPLTYQLTPAQIQTLIGDNTIWSDTNGENTAVYLKKG